MTKEFVKYEIALALEELGFDEPVINVYDLKSKELVLGEDDEMIWAPVLPNNGATIAAPLYQQAFKFFREKYNLLFNFISYSIVKPGEYHWSITWNDEAKASGIVKTYEEAEQACLDKLIEICKTKNNEQAN
jgi:hypothetical protein